MDLKLTDAPHVACTGSVDIRVFNRSGVQIDRYTDHNLVVDKAKEIMSVLVGEGTGHITKFGVGSGTDVAASTDTELTTPEYTDIVSVTYPQAGHVTFNCLVDYADANGLRITEFGLLNGTYELFAHKVRAVVDGDTVTGVIDKESDLKITCTWTLKF